MALPWTTGVDRRAEGSDLIVHIRVAGIDDLDSLVGIHVRSSRRAYADVFPPEAPFPTFEQMAARWRPALANGERIVAFVAEVDGRPVGGVIADLVSARGFGNLRHLYVDPDGWGSGVGRALHDTAVDWCARAGLESMDLWVLEQNERARVMYERWGWTLDPDARLVHEGLDVAEVRYVLDRVPES